MPVSDLINFPQEQEHVADLAAAAAHYRDLASAGGGETARIIISIQKDAASRSALLRRLLLGEE